MNKNALHNLLFMWGIFYTRPSLKTLEIVNAQLIKDNEAMAYTYKVIKSPIGELTLIAHLNHLAAILFEQNPHQRAYLFSMTEDTQHPMLLTTEQQLNAYFAGELTTFSVLLDFVGTEFQKKVWQALLTIPFGETRSYKEIATQIGQPNAVRAVGAAIGKNPISIITPCHRVIGTHGALTGFAGGLHVKAYLLDMENKYIIKLP